MWQPSCTQLAPELLMRYIPRLGRADVGVSILRSVVFPTTNGTHTG
jgi:hypothetical protein